jgi:hypothetical protein
MNCSDCQDLLSDYLDEDLNENSRNSVSNHLKNCRECKIVYQDLDQIIKVSRELPSLAPENALWLGIEKEIRDLTQSPPHPQASLWARFWGYRWQFSLSMPQLAGSAIALVLLFLAFGSLSAWLPQATFKAGAAQATVMARPINNIINPEEAELKASIDRLSHTIEQRRSNWDPQMQQLFDRNLAIVDRSIEDSRQFAQRNPNDRIAHEMIMIAYQEKLRLLEQFSSL